jgi:hypothetical protein
MESAVRENSEKDLILCFHLTLVLDDLYLVPADTKLLTQ